MAQKFVGVDLGTHQVKVVVVTSGLRGAQVVAVHEEAVPPPAPQEGDEEVDPLDPSLHIALHLLRRHGLLRESVGVAFPCGLASYRLLRFPFADARRIAQAIGFEAEGQFPLPLEELRYDHLVTPSPQGGGRALVVAARTERVARVAAAFKGAGVDLKLITCGTAAIAQVVEAPVVPLEPELAGEGVQPVSLVLDIGHSTTEFVAVTDKGPVAARTLRRGGRHVTTALAKGYDFDAQAAEAAKHENGFLPHRGLQDMNDEQLEAGRIVAQSLEPLVRELEHTRMWLRSACGYEVTSLLLAGGSAKLNGLAEYLTEQTGLSASPVTPNASVVRNAEGRDWTTTCAALGTAFGTARRPLIQLHDISGAQGDASWMQQRMATMVAIGVAVMAFGALDTIAQIKALEAERAAHRTELASMSEKVFGESLEDPAQVDERLAEVEGQDLISLVPRRGALDVLGMITEAVTPYDANLPDQAGGAALGVAGQPLEGDAEGLDGGAGDGNAAPGATPGEPEGAQPEDAAPGETADGAEGAVAVTDPTKGISRADDVVISHLDIRKAKVELKATALRSVAQDALRLRLQGTGCLQNVSPGRIRDQNERKMFEMTMDNRCFDEEPGTEGASG